MGEAWWGGNSWITKKGPKVEPSACIQTTSITFCSFSTTTETLVNVYAVAQFHLSASCQWIWMQQTFWGKMAYQQSLKMKGCWTMSHLVWTVAWWVSCLRSGCWNAAGLSSGLSQPSMTCCMSQLLQYLQWRAVTHLLVAWMSLCMLKKCFLQNLERKSLSKVCLYEHYYILIWTNLKVVI